MEERRRQPSLSKLCSKASRNVVPIRSGHFARIVIFCTPLKFGVEVVVLIANDAWRSEALKQQIGETRTLLIR